MGVLNVVVVHIVVRAKGFPFVGVEPPPPPPPPGIVLLLILRVITIHLFESLW